MEITNRGLCGGGGGQAGSVSAGIIYRLKQLYPDLFYKVIVGTSTGIGIGTVANRMKQLKTSYTTTKNSDIWRMRGVNKKDKYRLIVWAWRWITGRTSWGDSGYLLNTIKKFYPKWYHEAATEEIVACVGNQTKGKIEYYSSKDYEWEDFVYFIFASMSAPPAMGFVKHPLKDQLLQDGGIREVVPLTETVNRCSKAGIKEIDCFVHSTQAAIFGEWDREKPSNHVDRALESVEELILEQTKNDIMTGLAAASLNDITVNIYYLQSEDIKPRFYFIPSLQKKWFNLPLPTPVRYDPN